ncbi:MAG: YHS domain-containing protein [Armatimonadetes bacterium]|nr:YHS domain-containing protein [Armatimonadota bacterium]
MISSRFARAAATVAGVLILGTSAFAGPQAKADKAPSHKASYVCPVMGGKGLKSKAVKYAYKGKTYYFCCKGCIEPFKKNPQKYMKAASKYADPIKPAGKKI